MAGHLAPACPRGGGQCTLISHAPVDNAQDLTVTPEADLPQESELAGLEEEEQEREKAQQRAKELEQQFEADALRQLIAAQKQQRKRANSESTEVPTFAGDIPTETFDDGFIIDDTRFDTVKYFHPRNRMSKIRFYRIC